MNIDVTEIIALFAQLAGPAFSVAFVFGFFDIMNTSYFY